MPEGDKRKIQYCMHCGAKINEGEVYCPKCGKLAIIKSRKVSNTQKPLPKKEEFTRKCSGCGSLISSTRLQQCPICNTVLEKIPEHVKPKTETQSGFIFANKKLQPEREFEIRNESWNSKEGYRVFEASIVSYLSVLMLILIILSTKMDPDTLEIESNIVTICLETVPMIAMGIYPIYYILIKKNSFRKLGFNPGVNKLLIALVIGALGAIGIFVINLLSENVLSLFASMGFENFIEYRANLTELNQIVKYSEWWILIYCLLACLMVISSEIAYRGVLQNTLRRRFGDEIKGKLINSLLVALIYAGINILIFLLSDIYLGLFIFVSDFLVFFLVGLLYELNYNLYNTIFTRVIYNVFIILLIFLI